MNDDRACPCLYVEPCHPHCTCRKPVMSFGCKRCCTYGSDEQQKKQAEFLARAIDAAWDDWLRALKEGE